MALVAVEHTDLEGAAAVLQAGDKLSVAPVTTALAPIPPRSNRSRVLLLSMTTRRLSVSPWLM